MRWVVKVGSGVLAADDGTLRTAEVRQIAAQLAALKEGGHEVVVVSSGAVASGFRHLGYEVPPRALPERQACASVGQFFLVGAYEEVFDRHGFSAGLVLLTHDDFDNRARYLNARNTIETLLGRGAVPIINENDAVAVEEILMGDNDQLAAMVSALVHADRLVLLTNVDGVYDREPGAPGAFVVPRIDDLAGALKRVGQTASSLGSGGMRSKLLAAQKAASYGIHTTIASGHAADVLTRLAAGDAVGTAVPPADKTLNARRFWIRFVAKPRGELRVDAGAAEAVTGRGTSLLPKGITAVDGRFGPGDAVRIVGPDGEAVARGLSEYGADELSRIAGCHSDEIEDVLGYKRTNEAVHRDDLVLEEPALRAGGGIEA